MKVLNALDMDKFSEEEMAFFCLQKLLRKHFKTVLADSLQQWAGGDEPDEVREEEIFFTKTSSKTF